MIVLRNNPRYDLLIVEQSTKELIRNVSTQNVVSLYVIVRLNSNGYILFLYTNKKSPIQKSEDGHPGEMMILCDINNNK